MDLIQVVVRWFHIYSIGFTKSTLFILGLIWSFKMVEHTLLNILITHLTAGKKYDLQSSVVVVNSQEIITVVFLVVVAFATEGKRSRLDGYLIVVFSTTACIFGMLFNFLVAGNDDKGQLSLQFFYPEMVQMAFAQAALPITLKAFLDDQFRMKYHDYYQRQQYTKFWWTLVSSLAAIFAQLGPLTGFHLKKLALVLIIVMLCFLLVFLLGFKFYYDDGEKKNDNVTWIETVERPVNILPLWICLSILSLVSATGSTFFFLEAITLAGRDYLPAIILLDNVKRFVEFVVSESSSRVLKQLRGRKQYTPQKMEVLRIGMGMVCCMLCCNLAVWASTRRKYGAGGDKMSVYWLIPQFSVLGLMQGLAKDGFKSLYESQAPFQTRKYGWALGELARGVGCSLNILCVFIFRGSWFGKNVGSSSLDMYYMLLSMLSVSSAMLYSAATVRYVGLEFISQDEVMGSSRMHPPKGSSSADDKKLKDKSL